MFHVAYLPISGSYFSRCLFLKGIFECNVSYRCKYSWYIATTPGMDYSWTAASTDRKYATTPGPRLLLARDTGSIVSELVMQLLALSSNEFAERSLFLVDMVVGMLCNRLVTEAKCTDRDKTKSQVSSRFTPNSPFLR